VITIPECLWSKMLDEFATEPRQVEQICYFDGVPTEADGCAGVATTLTIPQARLEAGLFQVEPEAMSQAGKHLRALRLRRFAQVHTHPTDWTGHSPWDDEWAYSKLPGAISIVLPHFARSRPILADAGVHLSTRFGWQQLAPDEVVRHVRVVPSMMDFRPQHRSEHEQPRIEPPRRRSRWAALAFWRR
jgi:hypothetical protein